MFQASGETRLNAFLSLQSAFIDANQFGAVLTLLFGLIALTKTTVSVVRMTTANVWRRFENVSINLRCLNNLVKIHTHLDT